jgi:hypothetical protein
VRIHVARWTGARKGRALWLDHHAYGWRLASFPRRGMPRIDFDNLRRITRYLRGRRQ